MLELLAEEVGHMDLACPQPTWQTVMRIMQWWSGHHASGLPSPADPKVEAPKMETGGWGLGACSLWRLGMDGGGDLGVP